MKEYKKVHVYGILAAIFVIVAVGGFFAGKALYRASVGPKVPVRMLFAGDMMFDRTMRSVAEFRGYDALLSCVSDYTSGTSTAFDLVVANLEGPITASASVSRGTTPGQPGNTTFTFDPEVAPALARANIRMVNLGNNHIFDFGRSGVAATMSALDNVGVSYFGVPGAISNIATSTIINGYKIAFVNYNQFLGESDPEDVMQVVLKMQSENDFVVVYTHWGDEYVPETETQKVLAHKFIDAGADMVIGSHPHVIQGHETYKGKHIYYSLGNFIFDQYWDESVRKGLVVEVTIEKGGEVKIIEKIIEGTSCLF